MTARKLLRWLPYALVGGFLLTVLGTEVAMGFQRPTTPPGATGQTGATGSQSPASSGRSFGPGRGPMPPGVPGDHRPNPPFWLDENTKKELNLTVVQVKAIQKLWDDTQPVLKGYHDEQDKQEKVLSQFIEEGKVEESLLGLQVDRVELWRSQANKTRTLMLYRMNKVLTPDQREKLKEIHARDHPGRGEGPHKSN